MTNHVLKEYIQDRKSLFSKTEIQEVEKLHYFILQISTSIWQKANEILYDFTCKEKQIREIHAVVLKKNVEHYLLPFKFLSQ